MKHLIFDIAITVHHAKLFSKGTNGPLLEVSEVESEKYYRGNITNYEEFVSLTKLHFKKHHKRIALIPPRVLFSGFFPSSSIREFIKKAVIESGSREVFLLDRSMAIAIGHSTHTELPDRRSYLMIDQDLLHVFAVDGINTVIDYTCELEMDYLSESSSKTLSRLGVGNVSPATITRIHKIFLDLKDRGFLQSGLFIWGNPDLDCAQQIISELNVDWTTINSECAIDGTLTVLNNLKSFLKFKNPQVGR